MGNPMAHKTPKWEQHGTHTCLRIEFPVPAHVNIIFVDPHPFRLGCVCEWEPVCQGKQASKRTNNKCCMPEINFDNLLSTICICIIYTHFFFITYYYLFPSSLLTYCIGFGLYFFHSIFSSSLESFWKTSQWFLSGILQIV